jgi:hypothetical protein
VPVTTPQPPPACDPWFSDNVTHVNQLRAYTNMIETWALGSGDKMGPYSADAFTHVLKDGSDYEIGYCP